MLKILNLATFTALLLIGVSADARDRDITVVAKPLTLAAWSKNITAKIEDGLHYPSRMGSGRSVSGIVSVRFHCSDTDAPTDVVVYRKSGERSLDVAATRAVSQIRTLHPMPLNLKSDQQYEANILFAESYAESVDLMAKMRKEAIRRNAWFSDSSRAIALNVGFQPIGQ